MATGHVLPGFGEPVTRFRRARSAIPLDKDRVNEYARLNVPAPDYRELRSIRENARHAWATSVPKYATTYDSHFNGQPLDEPTKLRPSSPTRLNKPHPPL